MFQNLTLHHPNPQHIKWITPLKNESLPAYAQRLLVQIKPSARPPVLIGLSFGGIIAQEVAKLIPVEKVILLSSLASANDLQLYLRAAGKLKFHQWLPFPFLGQWQAPTAWVFGAKTKTAKHLLASIIQETDLAFLRWSLGQILTWQQTRPAPNCVIIHGERDKILPVPQQANVQVVKDGEHLMLLNQPAEVSRLLNQALL